MFTNWAAPFGVQDLPCGVEGLPTVEFRVYQLGRAGFEEGCRCEPGQLLHHVFECPSDPPWSCFAFVVSRSVLSCGE